VIQPKNRVVQFILEVVELYFSKQVSRSAAELAYYLIMSFFPALICINSIIGTLNLNAETVWRELAGIIPTEALNVLVDYLKYVTENTSISMLAAGVFMLLYSASAAMRCLMSVMEDLYGRRSYHGIWRLVASVSFSALFLLTFYLSAVVVLTGNWFFQLLENFIHGIPRLKGVVLPWHWQWVRFILEFCILLMFLMLLYRATAPRGKPRAPILTGALLASVALVLFSLVFSEFIGMSSRYSMVYGSLASVIILLVWLYLCGTIIILGNVINRVWYSRKQAKFLQKREERS